MLIQTYDADSIRVRLVSRVRQQDNFNGGTGVLLLAGDIGKPNPCEYRELIRDVSTKCMMIKIGITNKKSFANLQ
jgi:hypothetical protein